MRVRLSCRWLAVIFTAAALLLSEDVVTAADAQPPPPNVSSSRPVPGSGAESPHEAPLFLAEATSLALGHSPELAILGAEVQASDARALQAGLLPNPELELTLEHFGGSGTRKGVDQSEATVQVAQPIELGGKRAQRRRVAELERRRLDQQTDVRRIAIVAEVRKRFLKALLAQQHRTLSAEVEKFSSETLRTVEGRVRAGAAAASERSQVRILLGRAHMELRRAEREIISTRRQLAALWGDSEPTFTAVGDLEDVMPPPPLAELLPQLEHNPELIRWDAEVERRAASASLERANRIPDVTVAAGARHYNDNDDFAAVVDISIPLPLFNRNQGGVLEAEQLLVKARAERDLARWRARTQLLAAYDELQMQFERISVLGIQVLADAKAATTETLEAYRRGAAHALDVLAAQRALVELQAEYFQALADYHIALVDVERLTTTAVSQRTKP